jgi:hypothetical protein
LPALALIARVASGQSLTANEFDVGPTATWGRRDYYGMAVGVSRRPGGSGRAALQVAGGTLDGHAALRIEATGQFLVLPNARSGLSPYAGLGIGYVAAGHYRGTGVLVALVGIEAAAGRGCGWFAELGLAGGLRARSGYRWRRLPPWWT